MTQRSRIKIPNAHAATTSGTAISSFRSAPSRLPPTTQASVTSASVRQRAPNVNGRRSLGSGTSSVIGFPVRFRGAFPNPLRRRLASLASRPAEPNLPECRPTVEVLSAAGLRPRRPIQPGQHPAHLRRRPLAAPRRGERRLAATFAQRVRSRPQPTSHRHRAGSGPSSRRGTGQVWRWPPVHRRFGRRRRVVIGACMEYPPTPISVVRHCS
jgi:hypothetical protein